MKYCSRCGKEIMDEAAVCPHCGCAVTSPNTVPDELSTGLNVLSFFIPLVGLVLYLVYHDKTPNRANAIGKWALIGVGVDVALWILNVMLISSML